MKLSIFKENDKYIIHSTNQFGASYARHFDTLSDMVHYLEVVYGFRGLPETSVSEDIKQELEYEGINLRTKEI